MFTQHTRCFIEMTLFNLENVQNFELKKAGSKFLRFEIYWILNPWHFYKVLIVG